MRIYGWPSLLLLIFVCFGCNNPKGESVLSDDHTPLLKVPGAFSFEQIRSHNGEVSLRWGTSAAAKTYAFFMGTAADAITTPVPSCSSAATSCTLTGLDANTTYYFSVVATNAAGSQTIDDYDSALSVGTFNVTSSSAGDGLINLAWSASATATAYDVIYGTSSGAYLSIVSGVSSPYVLSGLTNGVDYYVRVVARNTQNGYGLSDTEITQRPNGVVITPTIAALTPPNNDTYSATESLDYTVRFSEPITVTGAPELALSIGAQSRRAVYVSGSGTVDLLFRYVVAANDEDADGVTTVSPVHLSGGTLRSAGGIDADLTFAGSTTAGVIVSNAASISDVAAPAAGNYNRSTASAVSFTVTFSQIVNVLGAPRLTLTFTYTVSGTDLDLDGIGLASPLALNGGSIRNAAGIDSYLTYTVPDTARINVVYPNLVAWYDAQDSDTLFQNSACSVPVTADGHGVGCFRDKSGNNHHALQGSAGLLPVYRVAGVQAQPSLSFDGVNDMLSAPNHADFNNMAGLTAIVVFLPQILNGDPRGIISKRVSTASTTFSMFLFTGNRMFFDISTTSNRQNSNTVFAINNPYMVTMHFDGALAAASRTKFYIDGSVDATRNSSTNTAATSTGDFHIGSLNENYGTNRTFGGFIGEIFLFRRSLSTSPGDELQKIQQHLEAKWAL